MNYLRVKRFIAGLGIAVMLVTNTVSHLAPVSVFAAEEEQEELEEQPQEEQQPEEQVPAEQVQEEIVPGQPAEGIVTPVLSEEEKMKELTAEETELEETDAEEEDEDEVKYLTVTLNGEEIGISESSTDVVNIAEGKKAEDQQLINVTYTDKDGKEIPVYYVKNVSDGEPSGTVYTDGDEDGSYSKFNLEEDADSVALTAHYEEIVRTKPIGTTVLTADGETYTVTVSYTEEANLPADVSLKVEEITNKEEYEGYKSQVEEEILDPESKKVTAARFFDITLLDSEGNELHPEKAVTVVIETKDTLKENEEVQVCHFDQEQEKPVIVKSQEIINETYKEDNLGVQFEAESFSVYGIVGTETITVPFTASDGRTYEVTVNFDKEAGIPEGAQLSVEEVLRGTDEYDAYVEKTVDAVRIDQENLTYIKLLNISITDPFGEKVALNAAVDVQIRLLDTDQVQDSAQIVHFAGEEEIPEVIDPAVEGDILNFETDGFSIYAVVDGISDDARLLVKFMNGENEVKSMYVKKSDVTSGKLEQVMYDPGVPVVDNQLFMGWTNVAPANQTAETVGMTIAEVRSAVSTILDGEVTDGQVQAYYALMYKALKLYYEDENGIVFKTESLTGVGASLSTTVDATYAVPDPTKGLIGWKVKDSDGSVVYKNGDPITLTDADVALEPVIGDGHWLYFDENDGGAGVGDADYTPPVFVPSGEKVNSVYTYDLEDPDTCPTRPGYTFAGWYTAAEGGELFDLNSELTGEGGTTVYAHWTANTEAKYKIIIWAQKVTDDKNAADADKTYDYVNSVELTAATDTPITAEMLSSYTNYGDSYFGVSDLDHGSKAFQYRTYEIKNGTGDDQNGVNADGSTVVNVYYDRKMFSIQFSGLSDGETYYIPVDGGEDVYGLVDGEYVHLTTTADKRIQWSIYKKNGSITMPDSITQVKLSNNSGWPQDPYTVSVNSLNLLSNAIGSTSNKAPNGKYIYTTNSSNNTYIRLRWTIAGDYSYSYNGQPYTGQVFEKTTTTVYTGLYGQSFSKYGYSWIMPDSAHHWGHVSYLNAFNGNLFGHSNIGGIPNQIILTRSDDTSDIITIVYWIQNADLTGYTRADTATYTCASNAGYNITDRIQGMTSAGYRWGTSETLETLPTTWNSTEKMNSTTDGINSNGYTNVKRGSNTVLHIKYDRITNDIVYMYGNTEVHRVSDIPYEKSLSGYAESAVTAENKLTIPENSYFDGWYEDPAFANKADWSGTMPLGNKTLYAKIAPVEYHVVVDLDGGEMVATQDTNFWVDYGTVLNATNFENATKTVGEKEYSLAGWYFIDQEGNEELWNFSARITADSLYLLYETPYDAEDPDRIEYQDQDWPSTVGVFKLVAKWRDDSIAAAGGIEVRYVNPTGATVYTYSDPLRYGDVAEVTVAGAPAESYWPADEQFKCWQLPDGTEVSPTETFMTDSSLWHEETEGENTKLVITLTAVYEEKETHTPTHIVWYKNDGSGDSYHEDPDLHINEAVFVFGYDPDTGKVTPPRREGYRFLGWAKDTEREEGSDTNKTSTDKTDLFITYNAEQKTYDITRVAADEVMPYEALYAVWELNTQKVKIYKHETGNEAKPLEGAKFSLTGPEGSSISYTDLETNGSGYLVFSEPDAETEEIIVELPLGNYTLTEVTPPKGYNIISQNSTFVVSASGVTGQGSGYSTVEEKDGDNNPTGVYVVKVANSAGVELPHTGGSGTLPYTLGGIALIMASALMYGFRMRRRERRLN